MLVKELFSNSQSCLVPVLAEPFSFSKHVCCRLETESETYPSRLILTFQNTGNFSLTLSIRGSINNFVN